MDLAPEIERNVTAALAEDIGNGDLTARLTPDKPARATVIARQQAVLCGTAWFESCIRRLDSTAQVNWLAHDGDKVASGTRLCEISGSSRALLTAERTALNFLQLQIGRAHV